MRAAAKCLGRAHRGADAELPCRIVRGRDHAAPVRVAPDDERPLAQRRILQLFDRGEERVEVEVGENPHPRKATVRG